MARHVAVGLSALGLLACAPTFPSLAGGRTTPRGRSDLALGASVRVPLLALADDPRLAPLAGGGVAPGASVRHGLGRDVDLGLEVSGTSARAQLRLQLGSGVLHLIAGVAPHVGLGHEGGALLRVGGTVPLVLTVDVLDIYEVWVGARLGLERLEGRASGSEVALTGLRAGGVVGLAVGFRRFHVLVELGVDHELWSGTAGGVAIDVQGLVLSPAFALRLRV